MGKDFEDNGHAKSVWHITIATNLTVALIDLPFLIGLTIGLMGLDETNLHVLMASGSATEQVHAETVYKLLSRGKHWVLGMCKIVLRHDIAHDDSFNNSIFLLTTTSDTSLGKRHCKRDAARCT